MDVLLAIYDKFTFPRDLLKLWLRDTYFLHLHLKTDPSGEGAQHPCGTSPCCSVHASRHASWEPKGRATSGVWVVGAQTPAAQGVSPPLPLSGATKGN